MNEHKKAEEHFKRGKDLFAAPQRNKAACIEFQEGDSFAAANADILVIWGNALFNLGNFDGAINKFQKALDLGYNRSEMYALWGKSLYELKQYNEGDEKYEDALKFDKYNITNYLEWADKLHERGEIKKTIELYKKAIKQSPSPSEIYCKLLATLEDLGPEKEQEMNDFYSDLTSNPQNDSILIECGNYIARQNKYNKAIELYDKVISLKHDNPLAYIRSGEVFILMGNKKEAFNRLITAIKLDTKMFTEDDLNFIGYAFAELNEEEFATVYSSFVNAVKRNIENAGIYSKIGDVLSNNKSYRRAIEFYRNAVMLNQQYADAFYGLGNAFESLDLNNKAMEQYNRAIQINNEFAGAYAGIGYLFYKQKKYSEAAEQYINAINYDFYCIDGSKLIELIKKLNPDKRSQIKRIIESKFKASADHSGYGLWGNYLSEDGQYSEAAEQYKKEIEINPYESDFIDIVEILEKMEVQKKSDMMEFLNNFLDKRADIYLYIKWGDALYSKRLYQEAINQYKNALKLDKNKRGALIGLGNALYELKKYSEAIDSFRKIIELDSYDVDAYILWGNTLYSKRQYEEAVNVYKNVIEIIDSPEVPYYNWGQALYNQNMYEDAIRCFNEALKSNPEYALAHSRLGSILSDRNMYDEAIEHYGKAIELEPNDLFTYLDWGNTLVKQGSRSEAVGKLKEAIKKDNGFAYAYHNLASIAWGQGDYKNGRKAFEEACEIYAGKVEEKKNEGDAEFFYYYGGVLAEYFSKDDLSFEKAEMVLKVGLTIDPDHTGILSKLCRLYHDRLDELSGDTHADEKRPFFHEKIIECFRKSERILNARLKQFEDSSTLQELGNLYLKMEENDNAMKCFEKALGKGGASDEVFINVGIGVVYSRKEKFTNALLYFQSAHRYDPDNLNYWCNLAVTYLKLGQNDLTLIKKAEEEFKQILKIAPDHIDSRIGLGEVHTAIADAGEKDFYEIAVGHFNRAIQLAENNQGSRLLRKRELAAIYYSLGYAKVRLYEVSKPFGDESLLSSARNDFLCCLKLDPNNCSAEMAGNKIDNLLNKLHRGFPRILTSLLVLIPTLFVLIVTQLHFFFRLFNPQENIGVASYITLTFGSIIFLVIGLFLSEITKLKGAGIELEKGAAAPISISGTLGISEISALTPDTFQNE